MHLGVLRSSCLTFDELIAKQMAKLLVEENDIDVLQLLISLLE